MLQEYRANGGIEHPVLRDADAKWYVAKNAALDPWAIRTRAPARFEYGVPDTSALIYSHWIWNVLKKNKHA